MIKFEAKKSYYCRSVCDHDCVWTFTVVRRTEKTVWIRMLINGEMREAHKRKIRVLDGVERVDPLGKYSMSPVLTADAVLG